MAREILYKRRLSLENHRTGWWISHCYVGLPEGYYTTLFLGQIPNFISHFISPAICWSNPKNCMGKPPRYHHFFLFKSHEITIFAASNVSPMLIKPGTLLHRSKTSYRPGKDTVDLWMIYGHGRHRNTMGCIWVI